MALPFNGQISLTQIATEFGDTAPNRLTEFYGEGGAPGSGTLKMTDFYRAANYIGGNYVIESTGGTSHTHLNIPIGPAFPGRRVVLCIGRSGGNSTGVWLNSATLNGITMSLHSRTQSSGWQNAAIASASNVDTGTTATIVLNWNRNVVGTSFIQAVYSLKGFTTTSGGPNGGVLDNTRPITVTLAQPSFAFPPPAGSFVVTYHMAEDHATGATRVYNTSPAGWIDSSGYNERIGFDGGSPIFLVRSVADGITATTQTTPSVTFDSSDQTVSESVLSAAWFN